jgi:hypothetical protein
MQPGPATASRSAARSGGYIAGGVAWPYLFQPQQAMLPSVLTPQAWYSPALTEVKLPAGGVAWPY